MHISFLLSGRLTRHLIVLLVGLASLTAATAQDERLVTHRLEGVKVYRDRAQLTHSGALDLGAGQTLVVFSGVSPSLDLSSLQVSGTGTAGMGLTLLAVNARTTYLGQARRSARLSRLQDSLKLTQRLVTAQSDKIFVLQSEEKLLLDNIRVAGDAGLNVLTLDQLAQRYRTRLGEIRIEMRSLEHRREDLADEVKRLQNEINTLGGDPGTATQQVVVTLEAKAAGRATIKLVYRALGAGWSPEYDLRLDKVGEPLVLDVRARVTNATGVDWKNIPLALTTSPGSVNAQAPELYPYYLREWVALYRSNTRARKSSADAMGAAAPASAEYKVMDSVAAEEAMETSADLSTATQGALALDYEIAARYDIPADGQARQVAVAQHRLPAEVGHFAVPKLDKDAFLLARVTGFDGLGLIPGPASVYLEGAFVARTTLNPNLTTDTLRVGLGRDPRVQLKREAVREFTSRKVLGGAVRVQRGFTLEVRNARADEVVLTLEDQVPVSQDQRIKVKVGDIAGAEYDPATGKLIWRLRLKGGERRSVRFSYEVEHPRDLNVQGL